MSGIKIVLYQHMKRPISILIISLMTLFSCEKQTNPPINNGNNNGTGNWPTSTASIYTSFSEDWDNWRIQLGDTLIYVTTSFSEDWDNWDFSFSGINGDIQTSFSEDYDNWDLSTSAFNISMRTSFSEDWDNWDIDDDAGSWHADVQTSFSEDWDNWDVYADGNKLVDIETNFSEDFDDWRVYGEFPASYPLEYKVAILFIPIFTAAIHQQGIVE